MSREYLLCAIFDLVLSLFLLLADYRAPDPRLVIVDQYMISLATLIDNEPIEIRGIHFL